MSCDCSKKPTAREYRGKQLRDWHSGANALSALSAAAPLVAVARDRSAATYDNLASAEEREGFFDAFFDDLGTARTRWATFYAIVETLQREEWYWRSAGFDSFEDFWKTKTGQAFHALAELERVYNYAKLSDPSLFDAPYEDAAVRCFLDRLARIAPAKEHGGPRGNCYTSREAAQAALVRAATYRPPGETSIERRFSALRRDNPALAERMLSGEFIEVSDKGVCRINWQAARAASGKPEKPRSSGNDTLSQKTAALEKLLRTRDSRLRQKIAEVVSNCGWLMAALPSNPRSTP